MSKTREEILEKTDSILLEDLNADQLTFSEALRARTLIEASLDAADEMGMDYELALRLTRHGLATGQLDLGD